MTRYVRILVLILIGLFSFSAIGGDYGKGQQRPMPYERLSKPIFLRGVCKKIRIIEWRPTPGYINSTKLTEKSVNVVNSTCNAAVMSFRSFIKSKGGYEIKDVVFDTSLSFMPADMYRSCDAPRNLNDLKYRFAYRTERSPLWGWFQRANDWAYIRNDVLEDDGETINKEFVVVTAHELFHAMSYASGVFQQHKPAEKRNAVEEEMAQQFTEYLGLGR